MPRWASALGLLLAAASAGCVPGGPGPVASMTSQAPTLAFESIDGPPPAVFDHLVRTLNAEAQTRNLAIVSRQSPAYYRVRGYLSAQVHRGQTTIAWVWDVYDSNQQRATRISGEEPAGKAGRDAWAMADERVLRRIAERSLTGISHLMSGAEPELAPTAPAPIAREATIASNDDFAPEASGIYRVAESRPPPRSDLVTGSHDLELPGLFRALSLAPPGAALGFTAR